MVDPSVVFVIEEAHVRTFVFDSEVFCELSMFTVVLSLMRLARVPFASAGIRAHLLT